MEGENHNHNNNNYDCRSNVFRDERGEYRIYSMKNGEFMERDCGDHVELTPILITNPDRSVFFVLQGTTREADVLKCAEPLFSMPSTSMKIPKHLPQDITQRNKVLTKIVREAQLQAIYHYLQAHNKRGVSHEEIMTFLQRCFLSEEEEGGQELRGGGQEYVR